MSQPGRRQALEEELDETKRKLKAKEVEYAAKKEELELNTNKDERMLLLTYIVELHRSVSELQKKKNLLAELQLARLKAPPSTCMYICNRQVYILKYILSRI